METTTLIKTENLSQKSFMEELQDYYNFKKMAFGFEDLYNSGFDTEADIVKAIEVAIQWLELSGHETNRFFYSYLACDSMQGCVFRQWRMSREGLVATILCAPLPNQRLAQIRWNILNGIFH